MRLRSILTCVIFAFCLFAPPQHTEAKNPIKSLKHKIYKKLNEPFDTVRDKNYWRRALAHGKFDINDTTIDYPNFIDFCIDVYRWADWAFNTYDTTYVVPASRKRWKFTLKNNDWIDTYTGHITHDGKPVAMSSDISTNIGAQLSFMGLSYTYMLDIDNLITGRSIKHKKHEFSLATACVAFDLYYHKNTGNVDIHRFSNYKNGDLINERFTGLSREAYGLYAYWFFNNRRYAQAAAQGFSKIQKKSAGSFIAGLHFSHQDVSMDFSTLSDEMQQALPDSLRNYRFRYQDYCLIGGYGYNWAFKRNWLLNITALPSVGLRRSFDNSIEGKKFLFSANVRAKLAIVRYRKNFFYGAHFVMDGHWYISKNYSFFNSVEDLTLSAGIRF